MCAKLYSCLLIWLSNCQFLSTCINLAWFGGYGHRTTSAVCPWRHSTLTVQFAKTIWACQQLKLHLMMPPHTNCNCECNCSVSKCLYWPKTIIRHIAYNLLCGKATRQIQNYFCTGSRHVSVKISHFDGDSVICKRVAKDLCSTLIDLWARMRLVTVHSPY